MENAPRINAAKIAHPPTNISARLRNLLPRVRRGLRWIGLFLCLSLLAAMMATLHWKLLAFESGNNLELRLSGGGLLIAAGPALGIDKLRPFFYKDEKIETWNDVFDLWFEWGLIPHQGPWGTRAKFITVPLWLLLLGALNLTFYAWGCRLQWLLKWQGTLLCLLLLAMMSACLRWASLRLTCEEFKIALTGGAIWVMWEPQDQWNSASILPSYPQWDALSFTKEETIKETWYTWGLWPSWRNTPQKLVSAPLWIPLLAAAVPTVLLWRFNRRRFPPGHCRKCGYNLTGNVSGRCPECGTEISASKSSGPKPENEQIRLRL